MAYRTLSLALLAASPVVAMATDFGSPAIEIVDANALKGIKRVAVTSFTVQYVTAQVWDTSFVTGGRAPQMQTLQTAGQGGGFDIAGALDPAKMQSTTDALYQAFVTDLQAVGFDVVGAEQLANSKAFKEFASKGPTTPRKEEAEAEKGNGAGAITSVFYAPAGVPMAVTDKFDHLSTGRLGSTVKDPTLTFTGRLNLYTTNWPYYDKDVQKELDAATLHVRVYVPLAHVQVASSSFWGQGYSRQGIVPGLRLGNRLTRVTVGNKGDYAKMFLSEPYLIPGPIDSTVEEVKHPNVMRAMLGDTVKIYPGTVDPAKYWELLPLAAQQALKGFAIKLKDSI